MAERLANLAEIKEGSSWANSAIRFHHNTTTTLQNSLLRWRRGMGAPLLGVTDLFAAPNRDTLMQDSLLWALVAVGARHNTQGQ